MSALWRHGRAILSLRSAAYLLAALIYSAPASAQSVFDPEPVAYVLCLTNETKRLALVHPPIAKDKIIEQAFLACGEDEKQFRKSLSEKGIAQNAVENRLAQIQKFIRQTAPEDIDRFRINARPR